MLLERGSAAAALDVEAASSGSPTTLSRTSSGSWSLSLPAVCSGAQKALLELYRRVLMEIVVELPMLRQRWLIILCGIVMQYVHGMFTQLAHRMHHPQEQPLHDVGFDLTPELGPDKFWVSEAIFGTLFGLFAVWTFTPFVLQRKRFYTVVMWSRLLMVLVACQVLRVITFSVTQLPGPAAHCRAGEPTALRPWPKHWTGHVVVDVQRQVSKGCGDLIFSSHTIFTLTGILAYHEYGSWAVMKALVWAAGGVLSTLIVASRKHYTVDVVIAWYTVPLVFYTLHRRWTTRRPVSDLLGALGENDEPDPSSPEGSVNGGGGGMSPTTGHLGGTHGASLNGGVMSKMMMMNGTATMGGHVNGNGGGAGWPAAKAGGFAGGGALVDQVMVDIKGLGDQGAAGGKASAFSQPNYSQPKGRSVSMLKLSGLAGGTGNGNGNGGGNGVVDLHHLVLEQQAALINNGGNGGEGHQLLQPGSGLMAGGGAPQHHQHHHLRRPSQGSNNNAFSLLVQHLQHAVGAMPGGGSGLHHHGQERP